MGGVTFEDFWKVYPKRKGTNPRHPAELKFKTAVKNGADPAHIISSAYRYADEAAEQKMINTPYICMATTWLNQKRWLDYAPDPKYVVEHAIETQKKQDDFMLTKGYIWNGQRWEKTQSGPNVSS